MKRRILCFLLAALLLLSLCPVASGATAGAVYNYLVKQVKANGAYSNGAYSYGFYVDSSNSTAYLIYHEPAAKEVELCILSQNFIVSLIVPSGGASTYEGYVVYSGVASADFSVKASSYTDKSTLTLKNYEGNTAAKSELASFARDMLNYILEFTLTEIWDGGYRLKDLGFSKFTLHRVHYYDGGAVTTKPTCAAYGVRTYTCKICGHKETESIAPTGLHSWRAGSTTQPTCTESGLRYYTCTVCGAAKTEQISPLGHAWQVEEVLAEAADETQHGTARYVCTRCGEHKDASYCAGEIFTDMPRENVYSHVPIDWAVFHGITNGTSYNTFSPDQTCTRAQIVTFLWRAAGCPEPTITENPFVDVKETEYFYKAVLWAVEQEITLGTSATKFSPNIGCTRGQVVTFLWRASGKPEPKEEGNPFSDVHYNDYFYQAVLWAKEKNITTGTSATKFSPDDVCTRAQIVTFLYRAGKLEPAQPDPGENPDPGESPDPGEDPNPGENPDPGEDPNPGEDPAPGEDPDPGENPYPGEDPNTGENQNPGEDPNPGEELDP